jgi:hypothetical protein
MSGTRQQSDLSSTHRIEALRHIPWSTEALKMSSSFILSIYYGQDLEDLKGLTALDQQLEEGVFDATPSLPIIGFLWSRAALRNGRNLSRRLHHVALERLRWAAQHPNLGEHRRLRARQLLEGSHHHQAKKSPRPVKRTLAPA